MAVEEGRAAILEIDAATGAHRIFASGLRHPVGLAWEPERDALWVAVNERDERGSDVAPDYALGPYTASLGPAFSQGAALPDRREYDLAGDGVTLALQPPT